MPSISAREPGAEADHFIVTEPLGEQKDEEEHFATNSGIQGRLSGRDGCLGFLKVAKGIGQLKRRVSHTPAGGNKRSKVGK